MDDSDYIEGAITRNLFRTDSDSDEEEDLLVGLTEEVLVLSNEVNEDSDTSATATSSGRSAVVRREIMHVVLEEQQEGGSIAERLWPAAEYLAKFVLSIAKEVASSSSQNESSRSFSSDRKEIVLEVLKELLVPPQNNTLSNDEHVLPIVELGAGIGLTGIELATQLSVRVLLTDLEVARPLLQKNALLNQESYLLGPNAVEVLKLGWGVEEDYQTALDWYHEVSANSDAKQTPLLILGSDCVYWENLHEPLEDTLYRLLSLAPVKSMCLLATVRRWKRDNTFYQNLGKRTRTATHELQCTCLQETVRRNGTEREIMRIFAVQWVERQRKQK
jgi:hypothetical protein